MALIGNIPSSNPQPWHELRVEQFGVFEVQAYNPEAAWLKFTYFCLEQGLGFNPEEQLPGMQSAAPLCQERASFNNSSPAGRTIVTAVHLVHNPIDVRQHPEHADWLRSQQAPGRVGGRVVSLASVAEEVTTYPKAV